MRWIKKIVWVGVWGGVLLLVFILLTNLIVYASTRSYIYDAVADAPSAPVVLIPGAAVSPEGELSLVLMDRVDTAIELYKAQKVSKILVSGDNSTVTYDEVSPVRLYLMEKGVPDKDIFLDYAGFDTYSSLYRARDIFGVTSLLISTQSFHLPRAVFIAHRLGLEAYGVNADGVQVLPRNYIREVIANEKVILDFYISRRPKYLGETIPIMGDGRNYP